MKRKLKVIDLYCGAGGTSTGLLQAAMEMGVEIDLTPINHWETAVETHAANHPGARHVCASIEDLRPETFATRGELDWLVASPECTHFSRARGGAPVDDQRRVGARRVLDWAERLAPQRIWIENVREFLDWGPLMRKPGTKNDWVPNPKHRGALFQHWALELGLLGYRLEWRLLNCADHGAPTTRTRLIVQAARKPLSCVWPLAAHYDPKAKAGVVPGLAPWRTARECIDWSIVCPSIFTRKKALSANTLRRIEAGMGIVGLHAFWIQASHGDSGSRRWRSMDEPLGTVTSARDFGIVLPFVVPIDHVGSKSTQHASLDQPLSTLTSKQRHMLINPFVATLRGTSERALASCTRGVDEPLGTVATSGSHHALIQPALLPQQSDGRLRPLSEPCPTVSTAGALINPVLIEYYGTGGHSSCDEPMKTLTCKPRFGLSVQLANGSPGVLDIGYRMLHWRETAAAQSFPADYKFCGNTTEIHKQIGNAVPPALALAPALAPALARALFAIAMKP